MCLALSAERRTPLTNALNMTDKKTDNPLSSSSGKTPASQYLLVVKSGDAATKTNRVNAVVGALKAAKLTVQQQLSEAGDEVLLTVGAPFAVLCQAAEQLGYVKPRSSDGEMALFEYALRDTFENFSESINGFWHPAEEAALLLSLIDDVVATPADLEKAGLTLPPTGSRQNLISSLVHSDALVEKLPIGLPRKPDFKGDAQDVWEAYGSEVALYFGWMDHLRSSLMVPGAVGLLLYAHKATSLTLSEMRKAECLTEAPWYCPLLPPQEYTVDDDPWLPVFSVFIVLWAAAFVATWKQKQNEYAWNFGLNQGAISLEKLHSHEEPVPPSLFTVLTTYGLSVIVTAGMLALAFGAMVCSLNLQGYIKDQLWTERYFYIKPLAELAEEGQIFDPLQTGRALFGFEEATGVYLFPLVPVIGHVVVILTLNTIYKTVAEWLTSIEPHSEEAAAERSMQLKRFFFEAFDCYIALFYLAFVQCDVRRLRTELISIYTIDSFRRVFSEAVLPYLLQSQSRRSHAKARKSNKDLSDDKTDCDEVVEYLELDEYESFDDYLEMVIAFGYVVLFASAFPLAAPLTLVCLWVERASDLWKMGHVLRRKSPSQSFSCL